MSKFFLAITLARLFQPETLGLYGLISSALALSGFALGLEYHYFTRRELIVRPPREQAFILGEQLILHGITYVVSLPILLAVFLTDLLPIQLAGWFFALVFLEHLSQEATQTFVALSRPLAANWVLFIRTGAWVYPTLAIAAAVPSQRQLSSIFLAWFIGVTASLLVAVWCLRKSNWSEASRQPVDWTRVRRGLRISAPFVVTTGSSMGLLFFDRFVIESYHGLQQLGVYTFFAGITTALHTLVNTGVSVIRMPGLVRAFQQDNHGQFSRELRKMTVSVVGSAIVLAAALSGAIFPLLQFVGKSAYQERLDVYFVLLVTGLIRCVAEVPGYALYAKRRDRTLMLANLGGFLTSLVLNLLLVPVLSILGAALAAASGALCVLASSTAANLWTSKTKAQDATLAVESVVRSPEEEFL